MHRCPAPSCARTVPDRLLACGKHWAQVDAATQRLVYAAYRRHGVGSDEHIEAVDAAIRQMR